MFSLILAQALWFLDVQAIQGGRDIVKDLGHGVAGGAFDNQQQCLKQGRDRVSEFTLSAPIELRGKTGVVYQFTCTKRMPPPPKTLQQLNEIHNSHTGHEGMPGM